MAEEKKKKGFFAAIMESMTKTGGCCGNGETCGCKPSEGSKKSDKDTKPSPNNK